MIKEAGLENSGVMDSEHGRVIFISTTARKYFRQAYPAYAKVRNKIINEYIAKAFSGGRIIDYFKPKKGNLEGDSTGEIREVGGGKFVGILGNEAIRVIAVKGTISGVLPALPVNIDSGTKPSGNTGQLEEALK